MRFVAGASPREDAAFVVRYRGQAFGFRNRCAHVPMELDWVEGSFFDAAGERLVCATHGAAYDPASGVCIEGPCVGRRLQALAIIERDGVVYWTAT